MIGRVLIGHILLYCVEIYMLQFFSLALSLKNVLIKEYTTIYNH